LAKPKKTDEEIADDNERTNSMGLFNTADAYRLSGQALDAAKVRHGFADLPVRALYYHAIELYLKALLWQHHSVDELQNRFGHKIAPMIEEAEKHGLAIEDEDRKVLELMVTTDAVIRSRYIRSGPTRYHTTLGLERTCESLRRSVGSLLRKAGVMVRL
jgi:hypothetical protein